MGTNFEFPDQLKYVQTEWLRYCTDCWTSDGVIDSIKLVKHVTEISGVRYLLKLDQLIHEGEVPLKYLNSVENIVEGLLDVIVMAASGSEDAENQLIALKKLVRPRRYNLPNSAIKNIANRYYSPPQLSRGCQLLLLMSDLGSLIGPARPDRALTTRSRILLVSASRDKFPHLYEKAEQHWNRNSTLQSLAISIYLFEVNKQSPRGTKLDERTLKRDLAEVRQWAKKHADSRSRPTC